MLSSNKQRVVDRRSPLKLECKEDLNGEGTRGKRIPERVETIFWFVCFLLGFVIRGRDEDLEAVLLSFQGTTTGRNVI